LSCHDEEPRPFGEIGEIGEDILREKAGLDLGVVKVQLEWKTGFVSGKSRGDQIVAFIDLGPLVSVEGEMHGSRRLNKICSRARPLRLSSPPKNQGGE